MECDRESLAGAVSQRACVFCGSRVVLYPIADALHLVHGPIGCAAYTWDIRGALSSGPELHRLSFSTDLQEMDVIFGGEDKLYRALTELIDRHHPKAAFVYSTCIVGIIGDDLESVCKKVSEEKGIPVLPVQSEGFKGNKRAGYDAACQAMFKLVGTGDTTGISDKSVNILGDFNLAGEIWIIRDYFKRMGIEVVANITGDGRVDDIRRAHGAALNVVQCSGSTMDLAKMMQEKYGIPHLRVSYFGVEDMAESLYDVARFFKDPEMMERTKELVREELSVLYPQLREYQQALAGKKAAIYVGGAFKAFSLVKAFRLWAWRWSWWAPRPAPGKTIRNSTTSPTPAPSSWMIPIPWSCPLFSRKRTWISSWVGSKSAPSPINWGWASATTTMNARKLWKASWACSISPGKFITP